MGVNVGGGCECSAWCGLDVEECASIGFRILQCITRMCV